MWHEEVLIDIPREKMKPLWLFVAGMWIWLFWACAGEWATSSDYSYGWFVPPIALYFLWKRWEAAGRERWKEDAPLAKRVLAWSVLVLVLFLIAPLEMIRQTPIYWRPILWAIGGLTVGSTLSVAWLAGGPHGLRTFFFPTTFLLVGIPWPTFIEGAISFPLMQWVTGTSLGILHLLGYPATASGTTIALSNCTIGVEEACSGLRSLQTALMVGLAAGELVWLTIWRRVVLLGVAFVMALFGNQLRVLLLALAGVKGGAGAIEQFHDAAGYVVLVVLLAGVGLATWGLKSRGVKRERATVAEVGVIDRSVKRGGMWLVAVMGFAAFLGAHGWFWWHGEMSAKPTAPLLAPSAGAGFVVDKDVPKGILDVLRPDQFRYIRKLRENAPPQVVGYHFYWNPKSGNANQLYHRPDRCMPGAGWWIDGSVMREVIHLGSRDFDFNVFPFRRPDGVALMLWGAFLNGEPVEMEFNTDVYLNTATLWQFLRTGTRVHSFEVAALIMPYEEGKRPSLAEIQAYAARVFSVRGEGG